MSVTIDLPVGPVVPGCARLCPVERLRPGAIQAFSSRAGLQDDARWQSTTPSNDYYDYYEYYYYYYYYYYYQ